MVAGPGQRGRGAGKKLSEAGRHWARAGRPAQIRDDAAAWGIEIDPKRLKVERCEVWEEHREALEVFLSASNQWRIITSMAGAFYQGLDLPAVQSVMEIHQVEDLRAVLEQVQQIELGALEVLNSGPR